MRKSQQTETDEVDKPSKSQLKREADQAQKLGQDLLNLTETEWGKLKLGETLIHALRECRKMTSNNAKKRHFQYIGKLMRTVDTDSISAYIDNWKHARAADSRQHREIEALRDDLITRGSPAISELISRSPKIDRQKLRQLVTNARKAHDEKTTSTTARALFRHLRDDILAWQKKPIDGG
ncbi:MAG: ribosome biogenesis factor YjgA [Gammaproteobacteria bacterium]